MKITATCQVIVKLDVTLTQEEAQAFKCAYGAEPGSGGMSNSDYVLATDVRNQLAQSIPDIPSFAHMLTSKTCSDKCSCGEDDNV